MTHRPAPIPGQPGYEPDYSDVPESDLTDADREQITRRHRMHESWRREYQTTGADRPKPGRES